MSIEQENENLLMSLHECQEEAAIEAEQKKPAIKKGSKTDLINEIFDLCRRAQIACEHSEGQLKRMNKRKLLEVLAQYCEKVVEKKVMEKCRIKENMDHMESKQKTKLMNVGILRMAHDSLCYAAENMTARFTPYTIAGMTKQMKEQEQMSEQIDQCLAEIAEEYQVMDYIESPASRLALIWITAGVSNLRKKPIQNTNGDLSQRVRFGPTTTAPTHRHEPNRRASAGQVSNAQQIATAPTRRV